MTKENKRFIRDAIFCALAALITSLNIKSFIAAGNLVPGGFSGLTLLIQRVGAKYFDVQIGYSIVYFTLNIPGIYLAVKYLGRRFTILSIICVVLSSFIVDFIPVISITNDMLLIAVFGGIVNGAYNVLTLEANACGGGTDFIAMYFAKKRNKSCWNEVMAFNATMLIVNGFLFGWTSALYSIIYQFVNTQVVKTFDTRYKRVTLMINTSNAEAINTMVINHFNHTCTKMEGVGGFTHHKTEMLYTVCGEYELDELTRMILKLDPKAFINIMRSDRVIGNFIPKSFN